MEYSLVALYHWRANGLAHLPPIIARLLTLKITFCIKWPPRTHAEGGQVEPVLAAIELSIAAD